MQPAPARDQELEVHWRHILQLLAQAAGERQRAEGREHGVAAPDPRALEEGQLGEDGATSSSSSQTDPASPAGGRRGQGGSGNGPPALLPLWRQPAQGLGNSQGTAGRDFLSQLSRRTQAAAASAVAAAASLSAGQGDDASVSASAEHYRLTNENGGVSPQVGRHRRCEGIAAAAAAMWCRGGAVAGIWRAAALGEGGAVSGLCRSPCPMHAGYSVREGLVVDATTGCSTLWAT